MTDPQPNKKPRPNGRLALGLLLIGTGRPAGFAQFGGNAEAYLASLAPWLGLLIVLAGVLAWSGHPRPALAFFLLAVCNLLAPAIIADVFCRLWDRRQHWALYANVLNCAQWLMLAAILLLLPFASATVLFGFSQDDAAHLLLGALAAYTLWFHWFAARHALQISAGRAAVVMLCVVFGTGLILQLPLMLAGRAHLDAFAPRSGEGVAAAPAR